MNLKYTTQYIVPSFQIDNVSLFVNFRSTWNASHHIFNDSYSENGMNFYSYLEL